MPAPPGAPTALPAAHLIHSRESWEEKCLEGAGQMASGKAGGVWLRTVPAARQHQEAGSHPAAG